MFLFMKTIETMKTFDMLLIDSLFYGSTEDWARETEGLYRVAVSYPFAVGMLHLMEFMLGIVPVGYMTVVFEDSLFCNDVVVNFNVPLKSTVLFFNT